MNNEWFEEGVYYIEEEYRCSNKKKVRRVNIVTKISKLYEEEEERKQNNQQTTTKKAINKNTVIICIVYTQYIIIRDKIYYRWLCTLLKIFYFLLLLYSYIIYI